MEQPKLTDSIIYVMLRILQAKDAFVVPESIEQAKQMFPYAFTQENEQILIQAWPDINNPA